MSTEISNLVCDAVPDPPRFTDETKLKEQIRSQEQKSQKAPPNPEVNNENNKVNNGGTAQENGSASEDRESNHEKEREKKPKTKRKSRKSSSSGGTVINNVVKDSSNVCFNFSTQNQINIQTNGWSASKKDRRGSEEKCKKMPSHVESLAECQTKITVADKLTVKQNIGANWKKVARKLGFHKGEYDQKFIDYSDKGVGEVMFQILTVWEQKQGKQAFIGLLIQALWTSEEYDCAEKLADIHGSAE